MVGGKYREVFSSCWKGAGARLPVGGTVFHPQLMPPDADDRPYWSVPPTKQRTFCMDVSGRVPGGCGWAMSPDQRSGASLRDCLVSCLEHSALCSLGVQYRPGKCLFITQSVCGKGERAFPHCSIGPLCTHDNAGGWRIVTIRPTNGDKTICPPPQEQEQRRKRLTLCAANRTVPDATVCHGYTCSIENQRCAAGTPGATDEGNRCCSGMWLLGEGERTLVEC